MSRDINITGFSSRSGTLVELGVCASLWPNLYLARRFGVDAFSTIIN